MPKISSKNIKRLSLPQSPVVLAILDGWGYRKEKSDNAIKSASTPIMDSLWHAYPHTLISASGSDVGLPDGQMGNSEVGHLTIGSGRIIQQELVRISNIVKNNQLGLVNELKEMADSLKKNNSTLHITGLCSDGGVHSHIDHLLGLIKWASDNEIKKVAIHIITDGRDTPAKSASKYLNQIETCIKKFNTGEIALYELIKKISDTLNCGILLISHDLHMVMTATDHVVCLNGHVCCSGSPLDVAKNNEYKALFGEKASQILTTYEHKHDHVHSDEGEIKKN